MKKILKIILLIVVIICLLTTLSKYKKADATVNTEIQTNIPPKEEHGVTGIDIVKSENNDYNYLEDFQYELLEDRIILKKYTGKESILEIKSRL